MSILLQFRTIYTHNSTKGSRPAPPKCQFYYSFARSTRPILRKGRAQHHQNVNSSAVLCDRHVQSYERVPPSTAKIAILLQFRAIDTNDSTKGFTSSSGKIVILLQFRKIDAHDLTKGFIQLRQDRNFTTVSCDRHARSYERVHPAPARS